jgi:hypothetical protein
MPLAPGECRTLHFKIKPKEGLAHGTKIENKASIYFDKNPAITTEPVYVQFHEIRKEVGDVVVYPNPFKPYEGHTHITFGHPKDLKKRLPKGATIKIYTLTGECVKTIEEKDGDGVAIWDGKNEENKPLATGIYIYLITNPEGKRCTGKIVIIK